MSIQKYHVSKNLFDKSTVVDGYGVDNNSGNLFRSAALSASDYINISGESYIKATYITSGVTNQYGAFYDNNKTYISGYSGYSNAIAVPQNAVYTRITARTEYIDEFMLNSGATPLPYEPYGNTWNSIPYYIRKTATDNITSLPTTIYGDGTNASLTIKGNTVQNGTPTPSDPVTVSGVGERTGNLFDLSAYYAVDSGITNISIDNGAITYNASSQYGAIRYRFNLSVSDVFTVGLGSDSDKIRLELRYLKNNAQVGETIVIQKGNYQIIRGGNEYDAFSIYISNGTYTGICKASNIMLNSGSTALPYEPYGYFIEIEVS